METTIVYWGCSRDNGKEIRHYYSIFNLLPGNGGRWFSTLRGLFWKSSKKRFRVKDLRRLGLGV